MFKKLRRLLKRFYSFIFNLQQKQVLGIEDSARFGNFLYFFLHADIERKKGINIYILETDKMKEWLDSFPALRKYAIAKEEFRWFDNFDWRKSYYQHFNVDFSESELTCFVNENLLNEIVPQASKPTTIINIRRGDFYNNKKDLPSSFDQVSYVQKAFFKFPAIAKYQVEVVSDDVAWCEHNLNSLFEELNIKPIYKYENTPIQDFVDISNAKNLIVTNSTFSYWGGYICSQLDNENTVIAPDFGARFYKDSKAIQLHPQWKIIEICENEGL